MRLRALALVLGMSVALALTGLTGCSSSGATTITVYSGRTEELIRPLLERFSQETGIAVDFKAGDSADLALLLANEGASSPADVYIAQSPGATAFLDGKGLLAGLDQSTLDRVPADFRSPTGTWVGLSGRIRTLVYNTERVATSALPTSVFDLTRPEYRGRVGIAPTNSSFQDFVSAMRADKGDDATKAWLGGIAANNPRTFANNTAIVQAVGRGEIDMGLANHYYNVRTKRENPSVKSENYFFPNQDLGSLLLVTAASVTKSSSHSAEAQQLVSFLLNDASQKYFSDETEEYPLVAAVQPSADLPPLSSIQTDSVDLNKLGSIESTIAMIKASGLAQ